MKLYSKKFSSQIWLVSRIIFLAICTLAFQTVSAQSLNSDSFDGSTLDANIWTMVDPLGDSVFAVGGGQLSISLPSGQSHDAWKGQNNAARIRQYSADGDIEVEVKFDSTVSQRYQLQGVLAEADADTFIRAGFYHDGSNARVFTAFINGSSASVKTNLALGNSVPAPLYLRLKRVGDVWTHSYSLDGTTWQTAASFSQAMVLTGVSVYGGNHSSNGSAPTHTALVDYFTNLAAPLDPSYTVSTTVSGEGTVSKNPDQASYESGSPVELTATPATGYLFDSWSGDLAGNTNPETITVLADTAVQANFVVDSTLPQYSLSVTANGSGSVTLDPPGGTYSEGSTVTLTATPDSGWMFDGWTGDLVGTASSETITITSDMVVQANFSIAPLPQYNLNVTSTGSGSVTLDPAGGVYDEGTVVTLTATQDSGSVFNNWSGDLTGSINPETVTVTADMAVQANFTTEVAQQAPVISNINKVATDSEATITWDTDLASDSVVEYGLDSNYGNTVSDAGLATSHSITLTGLVAEVTYHFRVTSSADGASSSSTDQTFTTQSDPGVPGVNSPPHIVSGTVAFTKQVLDMAASETHYSGGAELTGDEHIDVVATDFINGQVLLYANDGNGGFQKSILDSNLAGAYPAHLGDVDGDGDTDVLAGGYVADVFAWYENLGAGAFARHDIDTGIDIDGPHSIVTIDMDGDGDIDLVTSSQDAGNVAWYENDGSNNFTRHLIDNGAVKAKRAEAADIDGDGDIDVVSASDSIDEIAWYENLGSQNFTKHVIDNSANGAYYVSVADIDGDNELDVLAASRLDDTVAWYRNDGAGGFVANVIDTNAQGARTVVSADLDRDGDIDVLAASKDDGAVAWFENDGFGEFTKHEIDVSAGAYNVFAIDMDRDGDSDVLTASAIANEVALHTQHQALQATVGLNGTLPIDSTLLLALDLDDGPTELTYTITDAPNFGDILLDAGVVPVGGTFTQSNIDNGQVAYIHTGADQLPDNFTFTVADGGEDGVQPAEGRFSVDVQGAPIISNVETIVGETHATITWTTHTASDSLIEYGPDSNYGSVVNVPVFDTNHSITLSGLEAGATYHFRVTNTDTGGLSSSSNDQTFTTTAASGNTVQLDGFDQGALDPIWSISDPIGDGAMTVNSSRQLAINVAAGTSHDVWSSGNNSVRVVRATSDEDFEVEVKFDSSPSLAYQLQGILVSQDANNFLRFDFYHDGLNLKVFAASFVNGAPSVLNNSVIGDGNPLYLRVTRSANIWTQSYSYDGVSWTVAGTSSRALAVADISVFAGNAGPNPAFTALVDYFLLTTNSPPVTSYTVSTTVSGEGTVSKTPDQASYDSGSLVELTATPATGYLFESWSGDLTGITNPETITVLADTAVQANFVVDSTLPQYSLSVTSNGSGSVILDPPSGLYSEGSTVTLTATPDSGWVFDGWSGDLTGTSSPATTTITSDMVVQANFSEAPTTQYSLSVTSSGSGSVTLDPTGGVYDEGTVVTLTATPDSGSVFDNWSGDLAGSINPETITVTADMAVQANFSAETLPQYSLSVTSTGSGSVTLDPAGGVYDEGTVVTLTATSDSGSIFNGWSGALAGLTNPQTLTMTSDAVVQASFVESNGGSGLVSDSFDGSTLDANIWTMVDPLGDSVFAVGGGQLSISLPSGQSHDAWKGQNNAARIRQYSADGDIEVEVKFDSTVSQLYQLQGVLAEADTDTFIRAGFYHDGSNARVFTAFIDGSSASVKTNLALGNSVPAPLYVRLKREGDVWTHSYSLDGATWQTAANFSQSMVLTGVSVYGGNHSSNGSAPAHTALVDYFANLAAPLDPTYTVSTTVGGEGTVSKNPDQASYESGSPVELTATPATGYLFDSWSGDLAGNTNPETITVLANTAVQANFVVDSTLPQYSLSVTANGSGSVTLDPPGGTYSEGSTVTLTATPDSGWVFDGWSGDLAGTASSETITITSDMLVQANFSIAPLPQYNLNVTSTGSGSVTLDPAGGVYDEGTVVTLTATPDSGSMFDTWSGDLTGSINPETITITADMTVQANFVAEGSLNITNISVVDTGPTTARVSWSTNEAATSKVDYGIASILLAQESSSSFTQNHSIDIDWLRCEQAYTIVVSSSTSSGTQATSETTHTTGACWNPGVGLAPDIDIWDDGVVVFGDRGEAQRWTNVRGRVSTAHTLSSFTYSLNGGTQRSLSVGPDFRRLSTKGDFNVEIEYAELVPGQNNIEIRAQDSDGRTTVVQTTVDYAVTAPPELPYTTYWGDTGDVESWGYAVDGNWVVSNGEVSADTLDYDRILAIGDVGWTDYEVTVPVTVNELGPHAYHPYSNAPLVGFGLRWSGHTPLGSEQPSRGWYPSGAFAWYRWGSDAFWLRGNNNTPTDDYQGFELELGVTYMFKLQVSTVSTDTARYRYKVWKVIDSEPQQWQLEITYGGGPESGSLLLISHHADAKFGAVEITAPSTP